MTRAKWEIKRDIAELEGLRNEAYNKRAYWQEEFKNADDRAGYYKHLIRQMPEKNDEYRPLLEESQSRRSECSANIAYEEKKIDDFGGDLAELDRELEGSGPGGGPSGSPGGGAPAMAIEKLTPEKKTELSEDKTPKLGRQSPDLGDDFDDR